MSRTSVLSCALFLSCATARINQPNSQFPSDPGVVRTVVLEPFFEITEWKTSTRTEYARIDRSSNLGSQGGFFGSTGSNFSQPTQVAITRTVQEKPIFARADALAALQGAVIKVVQERRPSWRVMSTSAGAALASNLTLVRTIVSHNERVESDRPLKNTALGFGIFIPPLLLIQIDPVHETERLSGLIEKAELDSNFIRERSIRYPTQPDAAINLSQVNLTGREFVLDVAYLEGVLADERPRTQVLLSGYVDLLATAVIALVEDVK
jgi:hypothetical protein